jgi:hypothetical protein
MTKITLTADVPSGTYDIDSDELDILMECACRDIHEQIKSVTDLSDLNWDEISSDDLIDRYQEYRRLRHLQDKAISVETWNRALPPF